MLGEGLLLQTVCKCAPWSMADGYVWEMGTEIEGLEAEVMIVRLSLGLAGEDFYGEHH